MTADHVWSDPYVWIDPADAVFVTVTRDALKMERKAYELAHAERMELRDRINQLELQAFAQVCGFVLQPWQRKVLAGLIKQRRETQP